MKVIALDFETANEQRSSPCSIGLAWIEDGQVARIEHHFIRPPGNRFASFNMAFHGIRPEHVEDAEEWPDVLERLRPELEGALVLAHNASFDVSVIRRTCEHYDVRAPGFDYLCTVQVARAVWPDLPSHKLNVVGGHLGVDFKHHDAAGDAYACGQVALAAMGLNGVIHARDLPERLGMTLGRLNHDGYTPSRAASKAKPRPVRRGGWSQL